MLVAAHKLRRVVSGSRAIVGWRPCGEGYGHLQLGRLAQVGQLSDTISGLAKLNNTRKARAICADARDMLGGNGILLEYHVIRHMADIEAIQTYEGTETMQTLIVGRDITGVSAFA